MAFEVKWHPVAERQLARHFTHVMEEARRNPLLRTEIAAIRTAASAIDADLLPHGGLVGASHRRRPNTWTHTRLPLTVAFERHDDHVLVLAAAYHARRN